MMVVRLQYVTRTSPVALLFPSYAMSTLPNLSSQSSIQLEGGETLPNVISITGQGVEAARTPLLKKIANQDVICKYDKDTPFHLGITSCNSKNFFSSGSKINSSANESESSTSETSVGCSKESDLGKTCPLSCVSSMDTSMTEVLEPRLEQDDEFLYDKRYKDMLVEHSLPTSFGKQESSKLRKQKSAEHGLKNVIHKSNKKSSKYHLEPFDICQCETARTDIGDSEIEYFSFQRSSPDTEDNAEEVEEDVVIEEPTRVLRPGMVLLKNYISPTEQISIVRRCRQLGLGQGGFYHPGYKDGSKLRLRMMCLGLDWDPQTRKYQKRRRIDRAKAPDIPREFHMLVSRAMQDSLSLISEDSKVCDAEEILPQMTPDVCIVNFYSETGRLGLHQDRDESDESLSKGLPVVSFSVGDAAEFLYGNHRDVKKAEKLVLESGDVLIFGGESRHVFHGISSIIPHSAPLFLREEARLRPGRLNLTFRQH